MYHRETERPVRRHSGPFIGAVVIIAVGVIFLLQNLGIFYFHDLFRYWPAILVALGLAKLVDARSNGEQVAGVILMGVGGWLLADALHVLPFTFGEFWPVLLILLGVFLLWQAVEGRQLFAPAGMSGAAVEGPESGWLNANVVFGGTKKQVNTDEFRGGQVSAAFGGCEIDLRRAMIAGDEASLKVSAVFGGIEIRVPESWSVIGQVDTVFGGFEDKTIQPNLSMVPNPKRLVVRGSAVFGGVEVKN